MLTKNTDLKTVQKIAQNEKLWKRVESFKNLIPTKETTYLRIVASAADREVVVEDPFSGKPQKMLMFASNNYLGLANHPHVNNRVKKAVEDYGSGIGGPPLLNGYHKLVVETEARLAALKGQESAILFSSGFMTNLSVVSALAKANDIILYDELSHASFFDGIKLSKAKAIQFPHNNLQKLEELLHAFCECEGTVFVCVEGVYSMDGNMAPLHLISAMCKCKGAVLIVDDAHGTGVLGKGGGGGTASHLDCEDGIDLTMGTFSKVFAVLTGNIDLINYLRFHARSYIFSASIPPPVTAAVLGGLEVMEKEPWLRIQLLENVAYAIKHLERFGFCANPEAAIIALKLPARMNIRSASFLFHQKGIFINPIEYPAVAAHRQRFRISMMATHTKEDIDRLVTAVAEVWNDPQSSFGER